MSDRSTSLSLNLLSLAYFAMGTASLAIVGTLPAMASSLGLHASAVAFLVSVFAITFAVSAPLLQILVGHWPRKRLVLIGLLMMAAGTFGTALSPNYPVLFAWRIVTALGAAAIGPVASALGASLVSEEKQGHALAVVFSGMTIATVIGVPLSTWLGSALGWRPTFALVGLATLTIAGLVWRFVADNGAGAAVSLRKLRDVLARPATALGIAVMVLEMAGMFGTYTMIAPLLSERFGAGVEAVSVVLMIYGLAGILGNFAVRRIARIWSADRAVTVALVGLMAVFGALYLVPGWLPFAVALLIVWAMASDIFMPSQQRRMVELAPEVRGLVLALNSSAIYVGMAAGSFAAGGLLPSLGVAGLPLVSVGFVALSLLALQLSRRAADSGAPEVKAACLCNPN